MEGQAADAEIAASGVELWRRFVADAGLQSDSSYDLALLEAVGERLRISGPGDVPEDGADLAARIDAKGCTATEVLVAVLGAAEPWSWMMRDLLELMRAAGARRTQTQLRARVNIDEASESLDLDLEAFAEAVEGFERLRGRVAARTRLWSARDLMDLWSLLPSGGPWPDTPALPRNPRPPVATGHDELDAAIAATYEAWVAAVARMAAPLTGDDPPADGDPTLLRGAGNWPDSTLGMMDRDSWGATTYERLHLLADHVAGGGWEWDAGGSAPRSPDGLIRLVDGIPTGEALLEDLSALERLLSLPVWRKRYDLYANWVLTRIVDALADLDPWIRTDGDRIDFAFRSTLMAEVRTPVGALAVYSELRSALLGSSVKRKEGVQPDYSLLVGEQDDPEGSSILEIECKQYQQARPSNFGPALHDYALARPRAAVVLVSYGHVSAKSRESTLGKVAPSVRDRCSVIGSLQPGEDAALDELRGAIRTAVGDRLPGVFDRIDVSGGGRIELRWDGDSARDLDLHLSIHTEALYEVDFERRNLQRVSPYAWLVDDVKAGPGPEVIEIQEWLHGTYRIMVHDYGEGEIERSAPEVVVVDAAGGERRFTCQPGPGSWWNVAEIDGRTGHVIVL